jgi:hypothetical protein
MAMSRDKRRALRLLAAAPNGATEAIMLAHGFTVETLRRLVLDGQATATPGIGDEIDIIVNWPRP